VPIHYWSGSQRAAPVVVSVKKYYISEGAALNNITNFIDRLDKVNLMLSQWLEWIGIAAMMLIAIITGIDVIGGKIFAWRLLGAIDIVTASQVIAMGFAVAMALIEGRHVNVEFLVNKLPNPAQRVVDVIVSLIGMALFALIIWRMIIFGASYQSTGEATATIYIPLYPLAYSIALASIPVFMIFLSSFLKSIFGRANKWAQ
jgi:TRAP-type C4-dicarboxylate transport system permease small subunit